jgi:hypothetical protein
MRKTLLLAGCGLLFTAHTAAAQGVCSLEKIQGTYVNVVSPIYAATTPMTSAGLTRIDADGHWVGPVTIVTPMGPMELASSGDITVWPDCTAEIVQHAGGYDHVWAAVILDNGKEIRAVHTDPALEPLAPGMTAPTVRTQTLLRLSAGPHALNNCSTGKLTGSYAKTCNGWTRAAGAYMPFNSMATLSSIGDGLGWGGGVLVGSGAKTEFSFEGLTFSVDPDCRGLASFGMAGQTYSERLVMYDEGKRIVSITRSADRVDVCQWVRMEK